MAWLYDLSIMSERFLLLKQGALYCSLVITYSSAGTLEKCRSETFTIKFLFIKVIRLSLQLYKKGNIQNIRLLKIPEF